jgi:DNA-binding transcriptional ArsR family regulator
MLQPVQLFKLLADETRSTIVMLLRESGEMCVCDICAATAESQPKISRHMALLREAELVIDRREGKWCITDCRHTCQHGLRVLLIQHGTVNEKTYATSSVAWHLSPADGDIYIRINKCEWSF